MTGPLAHFGGLGKLNTGLLRGGEYGARQWMLRIALQARHERQHATLLEARGDELPRELLLAIGECPGLGEDRGATLGDLLEHHRALDDDGPAGAERSVCVGPGATTP